MRLKCWRFYVILQRADSIDFTVVWQLHEWSEVPMADLNELYAVAAP